MVGYNTESSTRYEVGSEDEEEKKKRGERKSKDGRRGDRRGSDEDDKRDKEKQKSKKRKSKYRCMCLCWCHSKVDRPNMTCRDCEKGKHRRRCGVPYLPKHQSPYYSLEYADHGS